MDSGDATSDPFFLDWGSSVNVNEDLTRTIQSEILTIEKDIRSLDNSIRAEGKTSVQFGRDFSHSQAELINLARGAKDDRDNAAMSEQIQMRLSDSLSREVVAVISPSSDCDSRKESRVHQRRQHGDTTCTQQTGGNVGDADTATPMGLFQYGNSRAELGLAEAVKKRAQDVKKLKHSIQAKKESLQNYKAKLAEVKYQLENANNRIVRDQKNQATWNDEVDVKRKENDAEKERVRSAKEALYKARKNIGEYTQQHTNDLNALASLKTENANEEAKWEKEHIANQAVASNLSNQISTITASVLDISNRIDHLRKKFVQREDILAERQAVQIETEEINGKLQSHTSREEELRALIDQMEKEVESNEKELSLIKKEKATLMDVCEAREKEEKEVVGPARIELPKLFERGETLAREIASIRDKISASKASGEQDLSSTRAMLEDIRNQLAEKGKSVKEKKDRLKTLEDNREWVKKTMTEEIDQHHSLKVKFEEAQKAQKKLNAALEEKRAKEISERVRAREIAYKSEVVKLEKLSCGANLIKETELLEREYEEKLANLAIKA